MSIQKMATKLSEKKVEKKIEDFFVKWTPVLAPSYTEQIMSRPLDS